MALNGRRLEKRTPDPFPSGILTQSPQAFMEIVGTSPILVRLEDSDRSMGVVRPRPSTVLGEVDLSIQKGDDQFAEVLLKIELWV